MSEAIHFDTHKFVKRMTESGMTEPTAEALADEQMRLIQGELSTKQDMALVHRDIADIRKDIEQLRKDTKQSIEALRKETVQSIEELRKETKQSIEQLRQETAQNIENLRLSTKTDMTELKSDLIKWIVGVQIATIGTLIASLAFIVTLISA